MPYSKKLKESYDVIVVGGGPAGSSCASYLGKQGKDVLLLDRAVFPRDKTCGDASSGKSIQIMKELGIKDGVNAVEHARMHGITFSSPKGEVINLETGDKNAVILGNLHQTGNLWTKSISASDKITINGQKIGRASCRERV